MRIIKMVCTSCHEVRRGILLDDGRWLCPVCAPDDYKVQHDALRQAHQAAAVQRQRERKRRRMIGLLVGMGLFLLSTFGIFMAFLMGREVQSVDAFNAQFSEQSPTESVYTDDVVQNAPIQPVVKEMESPEVVAPKKRRFFYTSAAPGRHTQSQPTQSKGWGGWDNWLKRRPLEPKRPSVTPQLFKVESPKVAPKPKATVAPKPKTTKPQPEVDETLDDLIEVRVDVSPPIVPKPEPLPASPTKREILRLSDDSLSSVQLRYLSLLEQLSASVEKIKEAETQLLNWETVRNYPNAEKPAESEEEIRLKLRRLRAAYKKQCLRLLAYTTDKNVYHLTNGSILIGTQSGKSGSSLILTTNKGLRVVKRKEIAATYRGRSGELRVPNAVLMEHLSDIKGWREVEKEKSRPQHTRRPIGGYGEDEVDASIKELQRKVNYYKYRVSYLRRRYEQAASNAAWRTDPYRRRQVSSLYNELNRAKENLRRSQIELGLEYNRIRAELEQREKKLERLRKRALDRKKNSYRRPLR